MSSASLQKTHENSMPSKPKTVVSSKSEGMINSALEKTPEMPKKLEKTGNLPEKPLEKISETIKDNSAPTKDKSVPTQDKSLTGLDKCLPPLDAGVPKPDKPAPTQEKPVQTHKQSKPRSPRFPTPSFKSTSHNDLYRKLLPAVLFVLTFVTVMAILLVYMDTVALGAAQFRVNMSRDYELARIPQGSAPLVAYVRQLHLAPAPPRAPAAPPAPGPQVSVLDRLYGPIYNGTFIEFLPAGARSLGTLYLESARGWRGVVVRAAPRDYLALRGRARAAHACLSNTQHPREVTYSAEGAAEPEAAGAGGALFRSRVLCLPLYTLLLAADAARAHYVLLGGGAALPALRHVPYQRVHIQVIEVQSTDPVYRNRTTEFLATKNYTVAAAFEDSVMYALQDK